MGIQWPELVQRIIELEKAQILIVKHPLTPLNIANRIMRKDNYFMAMINKEVIDLTVPLPFLSSVPMLTKSMEWNLNRCLMDQIFDQRSFRVREKFKIGEGELRRRFVMVGILNLLLSPFIFMFLIIYFFFKHAQEMRNNPSSVGTRTWSQ